MKHSPATIIPLGGQLPFEDPTPYGLLLLLSSTQLPDVVKTLLSGHLQFPLINLLGEGHGSNLLMHIPLINIPLFGHWQIPPINNLGKKHALGAGKPGLKNCGISNIIYPEF